MDDQVGLGSGTGLGAMGVTPHSAGKSVTPCYCVHVALRWDRGTWSVTAGDNSVRSAESILIRCGTGRQEQMEEPR